MKLQGKWGPLIFFEDGKHPDERPEDFFHLCSVVHGYRYYVCLKSQMIYRHDISNNEWRWLY